MPRRVKPLSAKQIEKWRPDPVRTLELIDGAVAGLRARLAPNGEMTWSLSVRVHGVRRRIAVGRELGLAEARRRAEQMRALIAEGGDPREERNMLIERRRNAAKGIGTLESVIAGYFATGPGSAMRSGAGMQKMIRRVLADHLIRPALDVRSAELQLTLDAYPSKSSAQHAAAYMRPVMKWAAKWGLAAKGEPLEAPPQPPVQQRVLTHDEIAQLMRALNWRAHDAAARLMLMTGVRCEEACGATWGEIDLDRQQWVIPARRRKDSRPSPRRAREDHIVPLSRQAIALLNTLKPGAGGDLCFTGQRGAKLTNWPRWSAGMTKRLGFDVTPHALRRTCATLAGDLGCAPHVVQALLGHRVGSALHSGYNQSRYTPEVAQALQRVADMLDALAAGKGNVVSLRA